MSKETQNEIGVDALMGLLNFSAEEKEPETVHTEEEAKDILEAVLNNEEDDTTEEEHTPTEEETEKDTSLENEEEEPQEKNSNLGEQTDSFRVAQFLISSGELEDVIVEVEGKERKLSEFEDIDEETLKEVIRDFKNQEKENIEKNYVKVDNLTETQKNLVEIIKEGKYDELREVFENPDQLREPWEGYDPTNDEQNEYVYRTYLKYVQKLSPQKIEALVDVAKKTLSLDTEAQTIVNNQREEFKKSLETKKLEIAQKRKEEQENLKTFTKDLTAKLKAMDLKPEVALSMVKTATVKKENQKTTALEDMFQEAMKDPEKASEIVLFLTNRDLYEARIRNKAKLEEQVNYTKRVKVTRDNKKTTPVETEKEDKTQDLKTLFNF